MSNNPTIPAAVWACRVDGVPLVAGVVEGGCPIGCAYDGTGRGKHGMFCSAAGSKPPVDLVALRDARCEEPECRDGWWWCDVDDDEYIRQRCPRCVDGRLLVDVRVGCNHNEQQMFATQLCWDCANGDGYRTVKGLVDVVPVVEPSGAYPEVTHLTVTTEEVLLWVWCPGESRDEDDFDPVVRLTPAHVEALGTIQPGQWAWTFTEVEA